MAKISISGNAIVITSAISIDDIRLLDKYRPDALKLFIEEEGIKSVDFAVAESASGSAGVYGIGFNGSTRDENRFATLTVLNDKLPEDNDKAKELIADTYGAILTKLNALEVQIPEAVKEVRAEREEILSGIEIQ